MYKLKHYMPLLFLSLACCESVHDNYFGQLQAGTPEQRARAASFLGAQRVAEAVPHLQRALRDPVPVVRTKAAWALGMLCAKVTLRDLVVLLGDRDRDVRQITAWALMQIEEPEAIVALERAMVVETDAWVKKDLDRAVRYLKQFEGEADIEESSVRGQFF